MGVGFPKRTGSGSARPSYILCTIILSGWEGLWLTVLNGMIGSGSFWMQAVLVKNIGGNPEGGGGYSPEIGLREHCAPLSSPWP